MAPRRQNSEKPRSLGDRWEDPNTAWGFLKSLSFFFTEIACPLIQALNTVLAGAGARSWDPNPPLLQRLGVGGWESHDICHFLKPSLGGTEATIQPRYSYVEHRRPAVRTNTAPHVLSKPDLHCKTTFPLHQPGLPWPHNLCT